MAVHENGVCGLVGNDAQCLVDALAGMVEHIDVVPAHAWYGGVARDKASAVVLQGCACDAANGPHSSHEEPLVQGQGLDAVLAVRVAVDKWHVDNAALALAARAVELFEFNGAEVLGGQKARSGIFLGIKELAEVDDRMDA